jgi:hypothetical protein
MTEIAPIIRTTSVKLVSARTAPASCARSSSGRPAAVIAVPQVRKTAESRSTYSSVPMPTPARRAMSSSDADVSCSAKASRAAATSFS